MGLLVSRLKITEPWFCSLFHIPQLNFTFLFVILVCFQFLNLNFQFTHQICFCFMLTQLQFMFPIMLCFTFTFFIISIIYFFALIFQSFTLSAIYHFSLLCFSQFTLKSFSFLQFEIRGCLALSHFLSVKLLDGLIRFSD